MAEKIICKMASYDGILNYKVRCIKGLRLLTGMGLKEAKEFVEAVQANSTHIASVHVTDNDNDYRNAVDLLKMGGITLQRDSVLVLAKLQPRMKDLAKDALDGDQFELAKDILDLISKYGTV